MRHTENLPLGTTRDGAGLTWELVTSQMGDPVWYGGPRGGIIHYNKAYNASIFSVGTVGCANWDRATAYAVKQKVSEYSRAKAIVATYEGAPA